LNEFTKLQENTVTVQIATSAVIYKYRYIANSTYKKNARYDDVLIEGLNSWAKIFKFLQFNDSLLGLVQFYKYLKIDQRTSTPYVKLIETYKIIPLSIIKCPVQIIKDDSEDIDNNFIGSIGGLILKLHFYLKIMIKFLIKQFKLMIFIIFLIIMDFLKRIGNVGLIKI